MYEWLNHNQLECFLKIEGLQIQHKVEDRPFAEGSRDTSMCQSFWFYDFLKSHTEHKMSFERCLLLSTIFNKVLVIFHTKQVKGGSDFFFKTSLYHTHLLFLFTFAAMTLLPTFLIIPWLAESSGAHQSISNHGGVPIFLKNSTVDIIVV